MRIAVGTDHAGYPLKTPVIEKLQEMGFEVLDLGGDGTDQSDDYPDYARAVALAVTEQQAERGILLCGSGVGASIAANKVAGARASLCHDLFSARQGVEDDDMNILCLGARVIGAELAESLVESFMHATFSGSARHVRRLEKVLKMEQEFTVHEQ